MATVARMPLYPKFPVPKATLLWAPNANASQALSVRRSCLVVRAVVQG